MLRCQLSEASEWQVLSSSDTGGRCPKIENYQQCEYLSSYLSFLKSLHRMCLYFLSLLDVTHRPRPNTVTPKLCPGSRVRHLAPQTFHLPRVWAPAQDTPCNVMRSSSVLWLLFHFVYFNHELWTDSCSQKWLECHKTDIGHFYM